MISWQAFAASAPAIAEVGRRHLYRPDQGEVGLLATVDRAGNPGLAPVCPIFTTEGVYLSVAAHTPKQRDLQAHGGFALHAQVGADDEEFQIRGRVRYVEDPDERQRVIDAITFPSYNASDPIFELLISHALAVTWPRADAPIRNRWRAES
ncbi:MAG: pyridoxamine 5'-phosphate oxidase family protein [Gammaproteobacteria bacterium]|nr:pyridoxamine 5'-phosphate oxidase family protein [Gammaproteobacteria bacterium]